MSLAGAGGAREPLPTGPRRKPLRPRKQTMGLRFTAVRRSLAVRRNLPPTKASRQTCAVPPSVGHRRKAKPPPTKQVARLALYRRQAVIAARRNLPPTKASRQTCAVPPSGGHRRRRNHPQQSKPTGLPFPLSPVLFPLCAAFRFFLSSLPFCPRPALSASSLRSEFSPPEFPAGQGHIIEP